MTLAKIAKIAKEEKEMARDIPTSLFRLRNQNSRRFMSDPLACATNATVAGVRE